MSIRKKLVKGSIIRMLEFFAVAITGLLLMPFIIRSLGDEMYGLWIFVGSFIGYYGLLEMGLGSAVKRYISRAVGAKDHIEINIIVNTSFFILTILGLFALAASCITAYTVPLLIKNVSNADGFRVVILILGLNFAIGFPMRIFSGILSANIRYDLNTGIDLVKLAVRTVLIVVFLKSGYGIIALALITFTSNICTYIIKYFMVRHLYKYIKMSKKFIDKSRIKVLFNYSMYAFIAQIADQLKFNIDNLVITIFLGLNHITVYSIGFRLIRYFGEFIRSAMGTLAPVFSQYEGRGDHRLIREKFVFTTKLSSYLSLMIGGILIIFGKAFIERWMGTEYTQSYAILRILIVPAIFALMQSPSVQLLYGISKHKYYTVANSIEGISNLILSIILIKKFGIVGVALGTAIPSFIMKVFVQPVYVCRIIDLSVRKFYWLLSLSVLKVAGSIIIYWVLVQKLIVPNYFRLAMLTCGLLIVSSLCVYFYGFSNEEKNNFKNILLKK